MITKNKKNCFFKKIAGDNAKKTKILTEIQVLTKRFTKRIFKKKTRGTKLFKPINYGEVTVNTRSN